MFAKRMTGRCTTGAERDGGELYHAVTDNGKDPGGSYTTAICGAKPGRYGNGWSFSDGNEVTCPRCKDRMSKRTIDKDYRQPRTKVPDWSL